MEILTPGAIGSHPKGPHFVLEADHHVYETADGEQHVGMDIPSMLAWLEQDPLNLERIEAFALVTNNNGLLFNHAAWKGGERQAALLFRADAPQLTSGDGKKFFHLEPLFTARVLATKQGHRHAGGPCDAASIHAHTHELLALHGLRANMQRIDADLCETCGK